KKMTKNKILNKVSQNKMSVEAAYKKLYKPKREKRIYPKAHFVKLSMKVDEGNGVNLLFKILFILPIPIWLIKIILDKNMTKSEMDKETLEQVKSMLEVRGCSLVVQQKDVFIKMRTI